MCVCACVCAYVCVRVCVCVCLCDIIYVYAFARPVVYDCSSKFESAKRGVGLGSRPKKMYGERLGDGVEYHLMSPTPRC